MDVEALYNTYFHDVFLYLCSLSRNESLAEELTQETFCQAIRHLNRFRGESSVYAWLCGIAKNLWKAELRRRKSHPSGAEIPEQTDPALGRVGTITHVNTELIESVLDDGYIPVIASVGCGEDGFYNINADVAASEVASALGADKLVYLTDEFHQSSEALTVFLYRGFARMPASAR